MKDAAIYLDNGASTRVDERVADAARAVMLESYGNPSSAHALGAQAARLLETARRQVAAAIGAEDDEILFTSGGTEANALALLGTLGRSQHLIVSGFEHPSVTDAAKALGERGVEVSRVAPSPDGVVAPEGFARAVQPQTGLAACLWVQNELGTVQPVEAIARAVKERAPRCHLHVDGVQALGKLPIRVSGAPFDSLALSAHKIHGPKGVGALWLRRGAKLRPLLHGGGQERGLRPGTEALPAIVAFGLACELAAAARAEAAPRMARQRDRLWQLLSAELPAAMRHGDAARTAPHVLSLGLPGVPAEPLLHALSARGVYVSAGSACHARERKPSATLRAIGVRDDVGTVRLSLSRFTTDDEIARAAIAVVACVRELS